MTYNGWATYETWLTNIHFENWDFSEYIEQIIDTEPEDELDVVSWLASFIEESIREITYESYSGGNCWIMDLIESALSEIDWRDLASHYSEEIWNEIQTKTNTTTEQ